ncbi:MAG: ATP-binding cassette domain-containing protein [Planctomycetota bacterium]|nr:ATP-binding cassette domain-containing protein [Planctomycetota bacterium]
MGASSENRASGREAPVLSVRGLTRHYTIRSGPFGCTRGMVRALEDLSFDVPAGRTVALVGESGCGKTTAARCILRLIEPTAGAVIFEGTDILKVDERRMFPFRRRMQIVFQDPYGSLNPRMTVFSILREGIETHNIASGGEAKERVLRLLELVGLPREAAARYPHEFSGGQRQRIGIARALSVEPSFIICDEPVSALDVSVQAHILNLLMDLQERLGVAYLFISHDLAVVERIADEVIVMYLGRVVERSPTGALFREPLHPYTRMLLDSVPGRRRSGGAACGEPPSPANPPPGCPFGPRCPLAHDRCRQAMPELREAAPGRFARCLMLG